MVASHERLTASIDQHGTFATEGFSDERRRITATIERGRMELNELRIGDYCAGTECLCDGGSPGFDRISRNGE
jgi:hypothetical protein